MTKKKTESAAERIARMKREKETAKETGNESNELIHQLTHESDGEPDFTEIARKLEERKAQEAKGLNHGYTKMTIYVRDDIYRSFNGLITKYGQQKEYVNQALQDFVQKKAKELGIDR